MGKEGWERVQAMARRQAGLEDDTMAEERFSCSREGV